MHSMMFSGLQGEEGSLFGSAVAGHGFLTWIVSANPLGPVTGVALPSPGLYQTRPLRVPSLRPHDGHEGLTHKLASR